LFYFAREAAGAAGTRHSLRPHLGEKDLQNSGASRRGKVEVYLVVIARSDSSAVARRAKAEGDEAIQLYYLRRDGLLRWRSQ
jgi:hypothetical protein